ncbi:MAG TPA: DUF58 domain-containing protein [Acidobacteriaceae bacterium]|jgi:uncharacterized protein (DUF58 family)|nr:DUF58 domain-containing protein [Acidobacteriaceae bacterium]
MQTLIPQSGSARARPFGKAGRVVGFGLTPLAMGLLATGLVMAVPAFFHARQIYFLLGWDGLVVLLVVVDAVRLPRPEQFLVTRTFLDSPQLGLATRVELGVRQDSDGVVDVRMVDDLHTALVAMPVVQRVEAFPREDAVSVSTIYPRERGDFRLGRVYLRYRGALRLVERWAAAEPVVVVGRGVALETHVSEARHGAPGFVGGDGTPGFVAGGQQRVRVFPAHEDSRESTQFYLLRARQIELEKRKLQLRGVGREFESLRDYQPGDELRKISWTATARRGRLVTRQFTVERSQQVWMMLDAGRLSRTAFELRRGGVENFAETGAEREAAHVLTVTQLDQAATAATMLAQVIQGSGDKFAMLAYGREVQQLLPPGNGSAHVRLLIDLLSQTRSEAAEADHLNAVARLKSAQRRRGLIVWITELVDSVGKPELVVAASELVRRHLVVLVLLKHPELEELAAREPKTKDEMFHSAAAQEMLERRRETVAQLERQGVLIVETTAQEVGMRAVSKYLEVKAEGLL